MTQRARCLSLLLGFCVFVLLAVGWLLLTGTGATWLTHRLIAHVSDDVRLEHVHGSVLSGLRLEGLTYDAPLFSVEVQDAQVSWSPLGLMKKSLTLSEVWLQGVKLVFPSSEHVRSWEPERMRTNISFPMAIVLKDGALENVDIRIDDSLYRLKHIALSGQAEKSAVRFEKFKAHGQDVQLTFQGNARLEHPYPFESQIAWDRFIPGDMPFKGAGSLKGDIKGIEAAITMSHPFALKTSFDLQIKDGWQTVLGATLGRGAQEPKACDIAFEDKSAKLYINDMEFHGSTGSINLSGCVQMLPEPVFEVSVLGGLTDRGRLIPGWLKDLDFKLRLQGRMGKETMSFAVKGLEAEKKGIGQPFTSSGSFVIEDNRPEFADLALHSERNWFKLKSGSGPSNDLRFEFQLFEPGRFWPGLGGQWKGNGALSPSVGQPSGVLSLAGSEVEYGHYSIENFRGDFFLDAAAPRKSSARVRLKKIEADGRLFPSLSVHWTGALEKHRVEAGLVGSSGSADIAFEGLLDAQTWTMRFHEASFDVGNHGSWRLHSSPLTVQMDQRGVKPFSVLLLHEESRQTLQGSWSPGTGWKSESSLSVRPLERVMEMLRPLVQRPRLDKRYYQSQDITYH